MSSARSSVSQSNSFTAPVKAGVQPVSAAVSGGRGPSKTDDSDTVYVITEAVVYKSTAIGVPAKFRAVVVSFERRKEP